MKIAVIQYDIAWECKEINLQVVEDKLSKLLDGITLVILPEMFSTGFTLNASLMAEENSGKTMTRVREWARSFNLAVVGSFIAKESGNFFNRGFFVLPTGESYYYDKRHLFSIAEESTVYNRGNDRPIINYRGWRICLQICYDLRFPVWSYNTHCNYDLLLYVANWPQSRITAWQSLLLARSIENNAYVAACNRVGSDANGILYNGLSMVISPKGEILSKASHVDDTIYETLSLEYLQQYRLKFPSWRDEDHFIITE